MLPWGHTEMMICFSNKSGHGIEPFSGHLALGSGQFVELFTLWQDKMFVWMTLVSMLPAKALFIMLPWGHAEMMMMMICFSSKVGDGIECFCVHLALATVANLSNFLSFLRAIKCVWMTLVSMLPAKALFIMLPWGHAEMMICFSSKVGDCIECF